MAGDFRWIGYVVVVAIALLSLFFAFSKGEKWWQKNPSKLGFKWGYFYIVNTTIGNGLIAFVIALLGFADGDLRTIITGVTALGILSIIHRQAIQRRRWALILTTILSLNLLWMIINIFYLRNRWPEFRAESAERNPRMSRQSGIGVNQVKRDAGTIPQTWRIAIFAALSWVLAVGVFVVLFSPYGSYMRDDDMMHMIYVMFLPSGVGMGLYWAYERFVR